MGAQPGKKSSWMAVIAPGISLLLSSSAREAQITGIASFGDNLSDVGNDYFASGGTQPAPPSADSRGHLSNGPIWPEYPAKDPKDLGVTAPTPDRAGGTDYAFGGAETGPGYANFAGYQVPNIDNKEHSNPVSKVLTFAATTQECPHAVQNLA